MRFRLRLAGAEHDIHVVEDDGKRYVEIAQHRYLVHAGPASKAGPRGVRVEGEEHHVAVARGGATVDGVTLPAILSHLRLTKRGEEAEKASGDHEVKPPMPGKVIAVKVREGDAVQAGQTLVILEAMKMQNEIVAPVAGTVKELRVRAGDGVESGQVLVVIAGM